MKEYLLLGTKGLIGSFIYDYFVKKNIKFNYYNDRLENPILFEKIKLFKPKYIICAAGIVGKPNRDWCLDNPIKTIETNVISYYNLSEFCENNNIKVIFFSSIGIYNSINEQIFNEDNFPNNLNHTYLFTKYTFEQLVKNFNNVLILRLGHCITLKKNSKNLLTKILNFKNIHNKKMSITILDQVLEKFQLIINKKGVINLVSPGFISLYEIFCIYKKIKKINKDIILVNYDYQKHREVSLVESKYLNIDFVNVFEYLNNNIHKYN
tara:strand:- start:60 stop:857 length:798 start_codon:yes stop_codon:yes gene_type:complete